MSPLLIAMAPESKPINVVLPAPFGPISPRISFSRTEKDTSLTAASRP
jgi:hypothetical protein